MKVFALTDIGLHRSKNEDRYLIDEDNLIFAVCDGMGGHKGGEVAASIAIETLKVDFRIDYAEDRTIALNRSIKLANKTVWEKGQQNEDLHEMGTTITAAVIRGNSMLVGHVGDSSLFLLRDGRIQKITRDHTLGEKMWEDGLLSKEDVRHSTYNHVLTRALGVEDEVDIDNYSVEIQPGDLVLMSTDGLTDLLEDHEILNIIWPVSKDIQEAARSLLDQALLRGGFDNITIVLLSF